MIKSTYEKWSELAELEQNNKENIFEFYLTKNPVCRCYFSIYNGLKAIYIEFNKNNLNNVMFHKLYGMEIKVVDNEKINKDKKYIKIINLMKEDEIYMSFVSSLTDAILTCNNQLSVLDEVIETVLKYKRYFSNQNHQLSKKEEQGIFAELIQLKKIIKEKGQESIYSWLGPNKNKRDFVFSDYSLEVKSTSSQLNPYITISNELQLDNTYPSNIELFLKVYIIEDREEGENIITLSKEILELIDDLELKKVFISKMITNGVNIDTYTSNYYFSKEDEKLYRIIDDFPKITKQNLPKNIYDVQYKLGLFDLKEFEINE